MKRLIFSLLFALLVNFQALAQPIEFVVSASPGGPDDTVARKLVEKLEQATDLQFVIVSKPGGGHKIAYSYIQTSSKPTLVLATPEITAHSVFAEVKEVLNVGYFTNTLFVSRDSGIKNLNDLVELSKTRVLRFGHGGIGSFSHASMEVLCNSTLRCLDVPYKGGAEGMLAILTNTIDAYALVSYGSKRFLENDKYLAIYNIRTSNDRSWFKLFSKNLTDKQREAILSGLKTIDQKFYIDMGFNK